MVITYNRSIIIGNQVDPFTPRKKERKKERKKKERKKEEEEEEEEEEINERGVFAFKRTAQYKYR